MEKKQVEKLLPLLVRQDAAGSCGTRCVPGQDVMLKKVKEDEVPLRMEIYDRNHSIFLTHKKDMVELAVEATEDEDERKPK